jgi:hypothetical protein
MKKRLILLFILLLLTLAIQPTAEAQDLTMVYLPLVSEWWSPASPPYCLPPNVWYEGSCSGSVVAPTPTPPPIIID